MAVLLAGAQLLSSLDMPSSMDLVSYLDVGDAWLHGRWVQAINGYWNPLYSWTLAIVLAVVRPSARYEFPTVEVLDFAIYLGALAAFAWFLRGVRTSYREWIDRESGNRPAIPDWAWVVGGYSLFTWSSVRWINVSSNTPDMAAAGCLYVAWGLLVRLDREERPGLYPWLGAALACGYLLRTPMLIVAAVMLATMAWQAATGARRRGVFVATLVTAVLCGPFIATISLARHHVTIGDNARLNHAWLANPGSFRVPNRYWQGGPPGCGQPVHRVRMLWSRPAAYEFSAPIGGTYPAWTDPSYWYEGLTYHFDLSAEWATFKSNFGYYFEVFGKWLLGAIVLLIVAIGDPRASARAFARSARYVVPVAVGLGLYLVAANLRMQQIRLQPPTRYFAAFVVILSVALAWSIRVRHVRLRRPIGRFLAVMLVVACLGLDLRLAQIIAGDLHHRSPMAPWRLAQSLQASGISTGMKLATIGKPDEHVFWARLARVEIIADVPDDKAFWSADPEIRAGIVDRLTHAGAQAVVSWWAPRSEIGHGWTLAPGTGFVVLPLSR